MGYPQQLRIILGIAKLLGAIALVVPGWPVLNEWAYAGFFIDVIGAFWSENAIGDHITSLKAVVVCGALVVSYIFYQKKSR